MRATRIALIATFLYLGAPPGHGAADSPPPPLRIQYQQGHLHVSLHHAPWDQVLYALERQTGIPIQVKGQLSGTVTQAFDHLPLEQGLRRLFNAHVVVFYEGRAQARVSRVWLVPKTADTPPSAAPSSFVAAVDAAPESDERLIALQALATQGDLEGLQRALVDPDQHIQAMALDLLQGWGPQGIIEALLRAAASGEPATRIRALSLLHETDVGQQGAALSALAQALADPDVTVKTYALHALTVRGEPEAVSALGQALHDPDASIRQMAIESIASKAEGRALLHDALSNGDETIRALAAFWLETTPTDGP
jgi:hypothetical protein